MKSKNILTALLVSFSLIAASLAFAQGGPGKGRGNAGNNAPANPNGNAACPCLVAGTCECPNVGSNGACLRDGSCQDPAACPRLRDGSCDNCKGCANGVCQSPTGQPKRDGTGGPGKNGSGAGCGQGRGNGNCGNGTCPRA